MTHDELLERVSDYISSECDCESCNFINGPYKALRAVVELHKPDDDSFCGICTWSFPCPTIQAIEGELK